MGVTKQQAIENKRSIVAAAEGLFRARGVDAVGLTELTKAAGFTQGGFYNHFKSKDALVAAVMEKAIEQGGQELDAAISASQAAAADPMARQVEWYLSPDHRANIEAGCPLTVFAGDVRRMGKDARETYAKGLAHNFEQLADIVDGVDANDRRKKAVAAFSQMVGAVLLSRAVVDSAPELADEILRDARANLLAAVKGK
ncbi:TetR/AcrR family transcriptional regulator [Dyella halodurans]|uniref:TetR/AcrR family transcriptional regulator n=1 Tax=Dyella halodurans TaxID=1920171 RepID=A0ABV9C210_9GAMM|nr:TetR/AcrR family transcriptional regulator [Dyella halodurans]